jgi:hypothetical protein
MANRPAHGLVYRHLATQGRSVDGQSLRAHFEEQLKLP